MAKIELPLEQRRQLEQTLKDLEDQDEQMQALDDAGMLHPGIKESREASKRQIKVLLEKF